MNVLLIAYYYPPINTGGTERPLKMAKYLPRFGHAVTVLTYSYDKHAAGEPTVVRIYDMSHNNQRRGIYKIIWGFLRLFVEGLNMLGIYASIYSFWKRAVINTSEQIIALVQPEVIIATYPPVETLEIGLYLSKGYNIPLVADFRDGLLFEPIESKRLKQYDCLRKAYGKIEKEIAQVSAVVLTVSPPITEYFINTYHCNNVVTIPNGFDPEDFENLPKHITLDADKFHIVHTGRFGVSDAGCDIIPFMQAVRKLITDHPHLQEKLRLHLVGQIGKKEQHIMKDFIDAGIIVYHGLQDRRTALAFQAKADLLLLITTVDRKSVATSKIFEYLYANRPILALTSHTYAETIITTTGAGWTVPPDDEKQVYDILGKIILDQSFYHALTRAEESISRFSRVSQMERLSKVLISV